MAKHPNPVPSQQLNVALPLPLYLQLGVHLYSDLEGRVPHGGYSRFLIDLLRGFFAAKHLDLAPYLQSDPGAFVVSGSPEAIAALTATLENRHE